MKCMRCGCENPDRANFCRACGMNFRPPVIPVQSSPKMTVQPQIKNRKKSSPVKAILLTIILLSLIAGGLYYFFIQPKMKEIEINKDPIVGTYIFGEED